MEKHEVHDDDSLEDEVGEGGDRRGGEEFVVFVPYT